jgi:hypothetical protein
MDDLCMLLGGRIAEEITFNEMSGGAVNDIERATDIARRMVCEWGMSDVLGPMTFGKKEEAVFLGREIGQSRDYSEQTAQSIDREVRDIVERNYRRAREILQGKVQILHDLAKALLEYETLDGEEVERLVQGLKIERPAPTQLSNTAQTPVLGALDGGKITSGSGTGTGGGATPSAGVRRGHPKPAFLNRGTAGQRRAPTGRRLFGRCDRTTPSRGRGRRAEDPRGKGGDGPGAIGGRLPPGGGRGRCTAKGPPPGRNPEPREERTAGFHP